MASPLVPPLSLCSHSVLSYYIYYLFMYRHMFLSMSCRLQFPPPLHIHDNRFSNNFVTAANHGESCRESQTILVLKILHTNSHVYLRQTKSIYTKYM